MTVRYRLWPIATLWMEGLPVEHRPPVTCVGVQPARENRRVIEGVLFDLDGTLFDHRGAAEMAVERMADRFHPVIAREDFLDAWFNSEELHMKEYLNGECSFAEQRCRRVRDVAPLLGLEVSEVDLEQWFVANYLSAYQQGWQCFPDAIESLRLLKDDRPQLVTGIITNGDPAQQHLKVERIGLGHLVGPIMTPADLGSAKPDPSSFQAACHHLGVMPKLTIYVGDSLEIDALGASRAGLVGVWLDRGASRTGVVGDEGSSPQTIRITDLTELPPLVRSLSV
jgi:HAD superfamily hydrolase (TIGR01549 family)